MKKYEEEQQEEQEEQQEKTTESQIYSDDYVVKLKLNKRFYNKKDLLNKEIFVTILGLGVNQFGRDVLICDIDGEERSINISGNNLEWLVKTFGSKITDMKGKKVKIKGVYFEGTEDIQPGVTLQFTRA